MHAHEYAWLKRDVFTEVPTMPKDRRRAALMSTGMFTAALLPAACGVSSIKNTDWTQKTNAKLVGTEEGTVPETQEFDYQLSRLWQDKPEYVELINHKHLRNFRVVTAVAPKYPYWLLLNKVKANVEVSFVVGTDGNVEDARILESSDSRFNAVSIEAVRQFKFIPAEGRNGPERAINVLPFIFAGRMQR